MFIGILPNEKSFSELTQSQPGPFAGLNAEENKWVELLHNVDLTPLPPSEVKSWGELGLSAPDPLYGRSLQLKGSYTGGTSLQGEVIADFSVV